MNDIEIFVIENRVIECKFGLKSLILLSQSAYDIDRDFNFLWKLGTKGSTDPPTDEYTIEKFKKFFSSIKIPTLQELEELYVQGLGELNIDLNTLEDMTPFQIKLAYQGYLRRMELQSNLFKLGIIEALHDNIEYIELIDKKFEVGTEQERERIFNILK